MASIWPVSPCERLTSKSHPTSNNLLLDYRRPSFYPPAMFAHIHIMKTAGQTVCDILRKSFGPNHCDLRAGDLATLADLQFARRFYPNLQSLAGHAIRPRGDLLLVPEIQFFTFLREPIARCLSHYQFERQRNGNEIDFLPWLQRNANYQTRILSGTDDPDLAITVLQEHVGFVGLLAEFEASLRMLNAWTSNRLDLNYDSRNIATDGSIKKRILANPEYVAALNEENVADQKLYEFVTQSVWPEQLARYQPSDEEADGDTPRLLPMAWSAAKRNLAYKPLAQVRQRLRAA